MDFWQKARTFAEEAAKRSQELTKEAAKRSQELTIGTSKIADIVSEAAKRSKEIAAEASKKADMIKIKAMRRADQIKSLVESAPVVPADVSAAEEEKDLERFGVSDELREFVKEITINTFQDFPLPDDSEMSDIPTVSNVRQDLTEWQERHANLVLLTFKEISKLRYELCPRVMKERKFWRIYFILVNNHVAPYEKRYVDDEKLKNMDHVKDDMVKETPTVGATSELEGNDGMVKETPTVGTTSQPEAKNTQLKSRTSAASSAEEDLDVFLLGDHGDSDGDPDDGPEDFDDDFDETVNGSDNEK